MENWVSSSPLLWLPIIIWIRKSLLYDMKYLWTMNAFAFIVHSKWLYLFRLCLIVLFSRDNNSHSIIKYCACMKSITNRFIYSTYIINIIKSLSDHDSSLMQVYFVCHLSLSYFSGIWFFFYYLWFVINKLVFLCFKCLQICNHHFHPKPVYFFVLWVFVVLYYTLF